MSIEVERGVGVPKTVAQQAVKFAKSQGLAPRSGRKRSSFEENDQVWAVFDRDEHPHFEDAVTLCEKHGVGVARSNPCFELWLILHAQDYNKPNDRHKLQAALKTLRPEYDPSGSKTLNCDELLTRVEAAEQRAAKQLQNRELDDCPYGNPSTTVGELTRAIRKVNESAQP